MVKLNKIYTRTGDDGSTGLTSGNRVSKNSLRIDAIGSVDETSSMIGLARKALGITDAVVSLSRESQTAKEAGSLSKTLKEQLARIQNDLFDLGADLSSPAEEMPEDIPVLRIVDEQTRWLETQIDKMNCELEPLSSFILPGGKAAELHMARALCRRAEREMVALAESGDNMVSQAALGYINRLSDFLFVAARIVNNYGKTDILWKPAGSRS